MSPITVLFVLNASRILRLRRFRFTARLNSLFGTEIIILEKSSPFGLSTQYLKQAQLLHLPLFIRMEMQVLPRNLSFLERVLDGSLSSIIQIVYFVRGISRWLLRRKALQVWEPEILFSIRLLASN